VGVLSDQDILKAMGKKALVIRGFREGNLTPNGYDLTIAQVVVAAQNLKATSGTARLPAGARFLVGTEEHLELGPGLVGALWIRSTWARRGLIGAFGAVDAGFQGTLTLGGFNAAAEPVELPIGERFAQIVFHALEHPAKKTYAARSGTYQGQADVTVR